MYFRDRLKNPCTLIRIGLVLMVLANLSTRFLHPTSDFGQGFADGVMGILFGISFGCLLLGMRLACRQRRGGGGGMPCARP